MTNDRSLPSVPTLVSFIDVWCALLIVNQNRPWWWSRYWRTERYRYWRVVAEYECRRASQLIEHGDLLDRHRNALKELLYRTKDYLDGK